MMINMHCLRCESRYRAESVLSPCPKCEPVAAMKESTNHITSVNYIATYQAQCIDGNQVTANLALNDVPEGASPGSVIEIITEQAYADIARSGMNATSVLVLNLSRVW